MGMNIYTLDGKHIGKRYAAGVWCWDHKRQCTREYRAFCEVHKKNLKYDVSSLFWNCPYGDVSVSAEARLPDELGIEHFPGGIGYKLYWHCPGGRHHLISTKVGFNPAQRELGFDELPPRKHTGIDGASGFIWQTGPTGIILSDERNFEWIKQLVGNRKFVMTEYDEKWPIKKFWDMFNDIIIHEYHDREFS